MTSSNATQLTASAKERVSRRVGTVLDGRSIDGEGGDARRERLSAFRVGFACAEFNGGITERLLSGALDALEACGGDPTSCTVCWAPGAFELPIVAQRLAADAGVDAVICLGAVIRGETGHYDFVAGECAAGIQRVQLDLGIPVVFGVLTTDTVEQALARSEPGDDNKGREALLTALQTKTLLSSLAPAPAPTGFRAATTRGA